jgi:hypothetical protein
VTAEWNEGRWDLSYSSRADLTLKYANQPYYAGRKTIDMGTAWLQWSGRREYSRIVMKPQNCKPDEFNLWTGFAVEPAPGDWSRLEEHIYENVCRKNNNNFKWVMHQLAAKVQNPLLRPEVAIVLKGKQGTGKGKLIGTFGKLFGGHYKHIAQQSHLTGRFNGHMRDALVLFADEGYWAGDKAGLGVLKYYITEPDIAIEDKGKAVIVVPNNMMFFVASNERWTVPAGEYERRFAVLEVSEARLQDYDYFGAIDEQLSAGGKAAFLHHLKNRDIKAHNHRKAPWTSALLEQQILTMSAEKKWWFAKLMRGLLSNEQESWEKPISWESLYNDFLNEVRPALLRERSMKTLFGSFLRTMCEKIGPEYWPKRFERTFQEEVAKEDGSTQTVRKSVEYVQFPALQLCRKAFQEISGFKIDFDEGRDYSNDPF